jgi:hypothetical protein
MELIMFKKYMKSNLALAITLCIPMSAYAGNGVANAQEPSEFLLKFDIVGQPSQTMPGVFVIGGPGYAAITTSSGAILDNKNPGLVRAQLSGAEIQFQGQLTDPIVNFTCLQSSCQISFDDGSVLVSDAGNLPLDGRVAGIYGPVVNENFNPPASTPVRILGCGGLKGVAGPMNGMVGSICFNGVFNVPDFQTNFELTGGSNCTITLHTPIVPVP